MEKELIEHEAVRKRRARHKKVAGGYIGDMVLGANDGIITTFAVVAGVAGASLASIVVVVLGLANLFADGFSMGSGNYQGIKSRQDYEDVERAVEEVEIREWPDEERDEIREAYEKKGFRGSFLQEIVDKITSKKKLWVDEMLLSELGIVSEERKSALKQAFATFIAFVVAGGIPLVPYLIPLKLGPTFQISIVFTALALFLVGVLRTYVTGGNWFVNGAKTLLIGGVAATVAYLVGYLIKTTIGIST